MPSMITAIELPDGVTVDTERYRFALGVYPAGNGYGRWSFWSEQHGQLDLTGTLADLVDELPEGDWVLQS